MQFINAERKQQAHLASTILSRKLNNQLFFHEQ